MKHLRKVIESIKSQHTETSESLQAQIWELICYAPKMPVRLQQQELLDTATRVELKVYDQYFSKTDLKFNSFKWGHGDQLILLTHGWGSKAADFSELIRELIKIEGFTVVAFDAPGNGSSEGHLSNLFLFVEAIKQITEYYGPASIMIGHSLGGKASVRALQQSSNLPKVLITIAPLINLKENFKGSMRAAEISATNQQTFLDDFEELYGQSIDDFHLEKMYDFADQTKHILLYDLNDTITPSTDIESFLRHYPDVKPIQYNHTTHAKIISDPIAISDILKQIHTLA